MIGVEKQKGESSASLVRRFSRKIKQSSVLRKARSVQFRSRSKSDYVKKSEALSRVKRQKKTARLQKLGKIQYAQKTTGRRS